MVAIWSASAGGTPRLRNTILRIARAIELLGAECIMSGVQPAVAQTLTSLGVGFRGLSPGAT